MGPILQSAVAVVSAIAIAIAIIALVHVYWGAGGRWPGEDERDLALKVVGSQSQMPGVAPCIVVAVALLAAAWTVAAAAGLLPSPLPSTITAGGTWAIAAILALRGVGGFFVERLDKRVVGTPFVRLNRRIYSPLCLALGAMCAAVGLWY